MAQEVDINSLPDKFLDQNFFKSEVVAKIVLTYQADEALVVSAGID